MHYNISSADLRTMNIFSFFAGAGFLDLGFEMTGHFNVVYVNEFHQAFNDIYRYARIRLGLNSPKYGHHVEDIKNLLQPDRMSQLKEQIISSKQEGLTGIIGGPPCPDFSVAGKNRGRNGDNGILSEIYAQVVCQTQPDFFLFENVKGLYRTTRHRAFFEELKQMFIRNGFYLSEELTNALEFGVPQDRERIILFGIKKEIADQRNKKSQNGHLTDFPWEKYKLHKKEEVYSLNWPTQTPYNETKYYPRPDDVIKELTINYWWEMNDVENHPNSKMFFQPRAGLQKFQTIEEGDDKKKCFKRLHRWRYSPTAAYGNNEVHIHPYKPRRISVSEALAIQSLPKDFVLPSTTSLSDAFKSVGNGVPFLLAKGLAESIHYYLS